MAMWNNQKVKLNTYEFEVSFVSQDAWRLGFSGEVNGFMSFLHPGPVHQRDAVIVKGRLQI